MSEFPVFEPELARDTEVTIGVQINGKMRGKITIAPDATEEEVVKITQNNEQLKAKMDEKEIIKTIYIPGRILNFILK